LLAAAAVVWLFRQVFSRTQSSSESRVASLVGVAASVVSPIPENGVGEISYVQSGSRYSAPAREEAGRPVRAGQAVRITRIVGSQFYVSAS
jgi:membrane protein implicated in regulation of membrane protease activity